MGLRGQREHTSPVTTGQGSRAGWSRALGHAAVVACAASLVAGFGGCTNPHLSNGIRPGPKGSPAVLLVGVAAGGVSPLACYDDLWVALKGPRDCADLVPPGAKLVTVDAAHRPADPVLFATAPELVTPRPAPSTGLTVRDRGPGGCGVRLQTEPAPTGGLWLYDPDERVRIRGRGDGLRFDLDGDGEDEWLERLDGLLWLQSPRGGTYDEVLRLGGCASGPYAEPPKVPITDGK